MIPVYVINLDRAADRRQAIESQLARLELPFTRCSAVDGRALDHAQIERAYDAQRAADLFRPLSRGELGCALSHLEVYRRMLADGASHAFILEDDAALGDDVPRVLEQIERTVSAEQPWTILLSHVDKYTRWGSLPLGGGRKLVGRYGHWWLAQGYVVTRAAARRLLEGLNPVWCAADFWAGFESQGIIKVKAVVPYCIGLTELADHSTMDDAAARAGLEAADKARRSMGYYLHRYLYHRFLYQILVRPFLRVARQPR